MSCAGGHLGIGICKHPLLSPRFRTFGSARTVLRICYNAQSRQSGSSNLCACIAQWGDLGSAYDGTTRLAIVLEASLQSNGTLGVVPHSYYIMSVTCGAGLTRQPMYDLSIFII